MRILNTKSRALDPANMSNNMSSLVDSSPQDESLDFLLCPLDDLLDDFVNLPTTATAEDLVSLGILELLFRAFMFLTSQQNGNSLPLYGDQAWTDTSPSSYSDPTPNVHMESIGSQEQSTARRSLSSKTAESPLDEATKLVSCGLLLLSARDSPYQDAHSCFMSTLGIEPSKESSDRHRSCDIAPASPKPSFAKSLS
jgi:hypothetical protein